jgi:hypothetical protein
MIPTKSIVRMELESIYETIDSAVIAPKDVILVSMSELFLKRLYADWPAAIPYTAGCCHHHSYSRT